MPQLDEKDVTSLVKTCMLKHAIPATRLLSNALDQKHLSPETASEALDYLKEIYYNLSSCFGAISLSPALSTESVIKLATLVGEKDDAYDHCLGNLAGRISHDAQALEFLEQESKRLTDPVVKSWLISILNDQK